MLFLPGTKGPSPRLVGRAASSIPSHRCPAAGALCHGTQLPPAARGEGRAGRPTPAPETRQDTTPRRGMHFHRCPCGWSKRRWHIPVLKSSQDAPLHPELCSLSPTLLAPTTGTPCPADGCQTPRAVPPGHRGSHTPHRSDGDRSPKSPEKNHLTTLRTVLLAVAE